MSTENETKRIAETILKQIQFGDRFALGAWGAEFFHAIAPSKEFRGGLGFKVFGLKLSGWVKVQLRWMDDYTITFINQDRQVIKEVEGVYCDQLVEVIDFVEGR